MCIRTRGAAIAVLAAAAALYAAGRPALAPVSVNDGELRLSARFPKGSCRRPDPCYLVLPFPPGVSSRAFLAFNNGEEIPLVPDRSGWMGAYSLRWYRYSSRQIPCADSALTAEVRIISDAPVYRGATLRDVKCGNGVARMAFGRMPAKSAESLPALPFFHGVRITVDHDGVYVLSAAALRRCGVKVDRIPVRTYRLFERGREVPLYVENERHPTLASDDRVLFYGKKLRSSSGGLEQFSETNVYWLTWGGTGMRVAVASGARRSDPTEYAAARGIAAPDYLDTLRFEFDNTIKWLGNIADRPPEEIGELSDPDIDYWYWGDVGTRELTTYSLSIPSPSVRGFARLAICCMGLSGIDSLEEDHRVDIFINEKPAGDRNSMRWDGQRTVVFETDTFSNDNLVHGGNRLTLQTASPSADRSALNWVEIAYMRGYESMDDQVRFRNVRSTFGKNVEYTLTGFSTDDVELWDIENHRFFTDMRHDRGTGKLKGTRRLIFQDSIGIPALYVAQATEKRFEPLSMQLDTIRTDWDSLARADYIAVGPDSFRAGLEPLFEAHRGRGLRVAFAAIDDIYNRFTFGIRDPESIRILIRHLLNTVADRLPRFLLLCGDTTHDLDKRGNSRNVVPTHLSPVPGWGPGADDGYFATVVGDDRFPDIAVGRFPAQNRDELAAMVGKTVRYIREPHLGYWRDNLLLLGGGEPVFTDFNDRAESEIIDQRMHVARLDADPQSRFYKDGFLAPQSIADRLNAGVFFVNFNGHGGGNVWSDNNFFSYDDLVRLHNGQWSGGGRAPVIFSFTCLTGFFESANYRSLGEEFVRIPEDGAAAFYGASAYTSRDGNITLNTLLLEQALEGSWDNIGELVAFCETEMLVRYNTQYLPLVRQYNILGDPALPWRLPPDSLRMTHEPGDSGRTLTVRGSCDPVREGRVRISLESGGTVWDQEVEKVSDGEFRHVFTLKDRSFASTATIRAYAWNDSAEVRGWSSFLRDTVLVHDVRIDPENPYFGDSVTVSCLYARDSSDLDPALLCLYAIGEGYDPRISFEDMTMVSDGSGRWRTDGKIALRFISTVNDRLLLRFRSAGSSVRYQSRLFSFRVGGRPDLEITGQAPRVVWSGDSLRIPVDVLNVGNAPAPPFSVAFYWEGDLAPPEPFAVLETGDSCPSGTQRSFSAALADTQGYLSFRVEANHTSAFPELASQNNVSRGRSHVTYSDLKTTSDSMYIGRGQLRIAPSRSFERRHRVFLFEDTLAQPRPLATESRWASRNETGPVQWRLTARPPLTGEDSLALWWKGAAGGEPLVADTVHGKIGFMQYDTMIPGWRYSGGAVNTPGERDHSMRLLTAGHGSFAVAFLADIQEPEIMVSVGGKALTTLDYTARDRPFSVFMSDPSGIQPRTVTLFVNRQRLESSSCSTIPRGGDLRSITLTAYPQRDRRVDSLSVTCTDLAGNTAERTFAYMPGSDLTIKSFTCHPNPFTARRNPDGTIAKIRFAFLLTDVARSATLAVYTVSGKKIRTWSLGDIIGYRQVEWDGRDRDGFRIANGTYYAKLIVKNSRKKDRSTIRIAKLEGF